jgi:tetratricopeptide (TPR) repeat protein
MQNRHIPPERILSKLDEYLHRNDYAAAERHLLYWLGEAEQWGDGGTELTVRNELMGLYRKLGREQDALNSANAALSKIDELGVAEQVGSATSYINAATVYKAFGRASDAIPLFERARIIYERELDCDDARLGGLYNNMALALIDLSRFDEARELYSRAIEIMMANGGELEVAITYLNMASAAESELGLLDADETICDLLDKARELLENATERDGYYAFVCEKCASVFDYYGQFLYAKELEERARRIYEGN